MKKIQIDKLHLDKKEHFYTGESCEIYRDFTNIYKVFDDSNHEFTKDKIKRQLALQKYKSILDGHIILPHAFILDKNDSITGYIEKNLIRTTSLYDYKINTQKDVDILYYILGQINYLLRELHDLNIYLGDFHFDNILINKRNKAFLVDFDNIKIDDLESFTISRLLSIFLAYYNISYDSIKIGKDSDNLSLLLSIMFLFLGDNYLDLDNEKNNYFLFRIPLLYEIVEILKYVVKYKEICSIPYCDEICTKIKRP